MLDSQWDYKGANSFIKLIDFGCALDIRDGCKLIDE